MLSRLLALLTILILNSGCGPKAPAIDDCTIAVGVMDCIRAHPFPKQSASYSLSPLQANHYLCESAGDYLVSKIYILNLETNLAKCVKAAVPKPIVSDCVIDGNNAMVYCSDGTNSLSLAWAQAQSYLCISPSDFQILKIYQSTLIQDIASCS